MNERLSSALLKLLRPIVRILLRQGVPFGEFSDLAKWVYVDTAQKEFGLDGRKQTDSRVSILSGLSRKEVRRVKLLPMPDQWAAKGHHNRAARVISGWMRDKTFCDSRGRPASLPVDGEEPSFETLVYKHSGDVPMRAILDELDHVGAVERLRDGRIKLVARGYVPKRGLDEKIDLLGTDVALLADTIHHNIISDDDVSRFQRKVAYDNLPEEALPELKARVEKQGQGLLEKLDRWLVEQDRDINPDASGSGRKRAGIGIYYFEEDVDE